MTTATITPSPATEFALPTYTDERLYGPLEPGAGGKINLPSDPRERRGFLMSDVAEHASWLEAERAHIRELRRPFAGLRPLPPVGSTEHRIIRRLSNDAQRIQNILKEIGNVAIQLEAAAPPSALRRRDALKTLVPHLESIDAAGLDGAMVKGIDKLRTEAKRQLAEINAALQEATWDELCELTEEAE